ncbi:MCPT1 protease, partial [Amia calva]|nr:MCPT1 protease [Amia calva]
MPSTCLLLLTALLPALALSTSFDSEIINGKVAKKNSLKYMASVQVNGKHHCGGFLVSKKFVMTAAHCYKGEKMNVVLGVHDLESTKKGKNIKKFIVKKEYRHPEYKDLKSGHDIMLLQLSETVKLGKNLEVVMLPQKDVELKPNSECIVAGWGAIQSGKTSVANLRVVNVTTIDNKVCQKEWARFLKLPQNILCAGGFGTKNGACQGDSGGPLVCRGVVSGIVSFNYRNNCDYPNLPNVYTQVSKFLPWIKKIITNNS